MPKTKKFDEDGMRLQTWQKAAVDLAPITGDDAAAALIDMGIRSLRHTPKYEDSEDGLQKFQQKTLEYFQYVQKVNADQDNEKKLMTDIESWAVYMGLTRQTINAYYANRGDEWKDFISRAKEVILAAKKVRAYSHQAPPIFAIFDLVNNHGYKNTSDIRIEAETTGYKPQLTPEQIAARIEQDIPDDIPD